MKRIAIKSQKGATLIIAMIFLVVLSIIGLAGMEVTGMEERMAGNMRERNIAFQAAEAALVNGEDFLAASGALPAFDNTNGYYALRTDGLKTWEQNIWGTSSAIQTYSGSGFTGLSAMPAYIIEDLGGAAVSLDPSEPPPGGNYYRVTARSLGQTRSSEVILQTVYKR